MNTLCTSKKPSTKESDERTKAKSRLPRKPRFADALVWVFEILRPDWDPLAEGETAELDELLGQAAVEGVRLGSAVEAGA